MNVSVVLRMSQCLVDVVELDALGGIVTIHGLQTGDFSQEGRSGQAAEDQHRVLSLQAAEFERLAGIVKSGNIRQRLADFG